MDDRRERDHDASRPRDDGATFEPARVSGPTRRPIVGVALVVGVMVAGIGLAGALDGVRTSPPVRASADAAVATLPGSVGLASGGPSVAGPVAEPVLLTLDARATARHLFVHGDVFSLDATLVIVSIADAAGHVVEERSLDLPGGSTAFRLGANDRFDAQFPLDGPIGIDERWLEARAYDRFGETIASVRRPLSLGREASQRWAETGT